MLSLRFRDQRSITCVLLQSPFSPPRQRSHTIPTFLHFSFCYPSSKNGSWERLLWKGPPQVVNSLGQGSWLSLDTAHLTFERCYQSHVCALHGLWSPARQVSSPRLLRWTSSFHRCLLRPQPQRRVDLPVKTLSQVLPALPRPNTWPSIEAMRPNTSRMTPRLPASTRRVFIPSRHRSTHSKSPTRPDKQLDSALRSKHSH